MFAGGNFTYSWRLLLVLVSLIASTSALCAPAELKLENELLLELRLDGQKLGLDILGYQRGEGFLLSLNELTDGLGFPIKVNGANGSASGWYISEDREFSLDLENSEVISGGKQWPLVDGEVVMFQGGLYVETSALEKWFPLRLSAVVRELYLNVEALEPLPIQQRTNRRERIVDRSPDSQKPQHPLQLTPYQFIGPHITKLRTGYFTVRQTPDSAAEYGANYAVLSRGDFAWMTSTLSLAGQTDNSLAAARFKLERTAFDGPLGVNHIELGDVDSVGYRGILLKGRSGPNAQSGRSDNESVSLEGSQLPDWDVELYQNGQLIMIETTGQDGYYLFEDVPLLFGENRFELKFFGPFGEIESREEFYFLGPGMLDPGRISYGVSAAQNGRTVFGLNDTEGDAEQGSGIYAGEFNLGISRNVTAGASVRSVQENGQRREYSNANLGLSTSRLYSSISYSDTSGAQNSVSASLRTRIGGSNLNLGYTRFFDHPALAISPQRWRTSLGVTSSVFSVPIKFQANALEQADSTVLNAAISATKSLSGLGQFSSSLWYSSVEERLNGSTTSQTGGQLSFHTMIQPWSFRLSANYGVQPETELLELSADSSLRIDRDLRMDLSLRQNPGTDTTYYSGGINWQLEQLAVNARVSYDSNERWGGLITLSTALIHQPGTLIPRLDSHASVDSGSVQARVFQDTNGAEPEPYAGVDITGVQTWRNATTDEHGMAYLSRMPAHRQIDIELDESTLDDYELRSKRPGVSIISRPGSYAMVDFPLVRTAELEGHVNVTNSDSNKPVSRVLVLMKSPDGEVVAQTRTAFDGFFLFEGIEPGAYEVSLEEPFNMRSATEPYNVTVHSDSGVIRELDFTLQTTEQKTMVPDSLVKDELFPTESDAAPSAPTPVILASAKPEEESQTQPHTDQGTWFVQLGAYATRELAQEFWGRIIQKVQALQAKHPRYSEYTNMIRLLVGPGQSRQSADQLCQQLKADSLDCFVRNMD